jgi:hypothetical protein
MVGIHQVTLVRNEACKPDSHVRVESEKWVTKCKKDTHRKAFNKAHYAATIGFNSYGDIRGQNVNGEMKAMRPYTLITSPRL